MGLSLTVLDLAGSIALLLWGVHMVQTGVQRAFGPKLRTTFGSALSNRFKAFAAGLGVTAVLQSSTATGLMLTGFAAGGLVDLAPGLAVMLGANVGTTLIVQVFSFDVAQAAPLLILVGVLLFRRASGAPRDFGRVLIGLGLMFMALHDLLSAVTPYEDRPSLRILLGIIATQPLVDVVLAAALTWAAHSSVAIVLLVMSFATRGVVPPDTAFALVLGANLGTAINPCLEGGAGDDPAARRLPIGNLLTRVAGVLVFLPLLGPLGSRMVVLEPSVSRAVADFHTGFNLLVAAVFMAVLPAFAELLKRIPAVAGRRIGSVAPALPRPLGARDAVPGARLRDSRGAAPGGSSERDAVRSGGRHRARRAPRHRQGQARRGDPRQARRRGDRLSGGARPGGTVERRPPPRRAGGAVRHEPRPRRRRGRTQPAGSRGASDQARARPAEGRTGDPADRARPARERHPRRRDRVHHGDLRAARLLAAEKEAFRDIEARATADHLGNLREGRLDREQGTLFIELLRDMKRINMHLVAAGAYPVLEGEGELLPTRLRRGLAEGGDGEEDPD